MCRESSWGALRKTGTFHEGLPRYSKIVRNLPAASDLGTRLEAAPRCSRYLVVVCSPAAAVSRWVNEEIKTFKAARGEERVLCLIVDGEPNATAGTEVKDCFSEALRFQVTPEGEISQTAIEPAAADVRPGKGNNLLAKLRLISGLIGVSFDELLQRERRRRVWRLFRQSN